MSLVLWLCIFLKAFFAFMVWKDWCFVFCILFFMLWISSSKGKLSFVKVSYTTLYIFCMYIKFIMLFKTKKENYYTRFCGGAIVEEEPSYPRTVIR